MQQDGDNLTQKKKIAVALAAGITFVIAAVWIFVFIPLSKKELASTAGARSALIGGFSDKLGTYTSEIEKQLSGAAGVFNATTTATSSVVLATTTSDISGASTTTNQ